MIVIPWTGARSLSVLNEAQVYHKAGFEALIVPARQVGGGWTARPGEHTDVLRALRDVLLTGTVDPDRVAITGFSRGGHASWDIGLRHAERFHAIVPRGGTVVHLGGYSLTGGVFLDNAATLSTLVSWGTQDAPAITEGNAEAVRVLKKNKHRVDGRPRKGVGHVPKLTPAEILEFVGKAPARDATPDRLEKILNATHDVGHFWIEVLDREGDPFVEGERIRLTSAPSSPLDQRRMTWKAVGKRMCRISGRSKPGRVDLATSQVTRLALRWPRAWVARGEAVTVYVNRRKVFEGIPTLDLESALMAWHACGDLALAGVGRAVVSVS